MMYLSHRDHEVQTELAGMERETVLNNCYVLLSTLMSALQTTVQQSVVGLVGGWRPVCQCLMRADGPLCPSNSSD